MLDSTEVKEVYLSCLYDDDKIEGLKEDEVPEGAIVVDGITMKTGFDPEKIAKKKGKILEMLGELPESFMHNKGGGYSFLAACNDKDGRQWTGEHRMMELLFMLGLGINRVALCLPRKMWSALPGGVPYYVVNLQEDARGMPKLSEL